jgi:hypothetical protein
MEDDKFLFLKMHECAQGVDDDALKDIAAHAELVRNEPGDVIHCAEDVLTSVYLVVQGRIKCAAMNVGPVKIFVSRYQGTSFASPNRACVLRT